MSLGGSLYWIELDTGSVRALSQIRRRFELYKCGEHLHLWVVPNLKRLDKLKSQCALDTARFAVLSEVVQDPFGDVWEDRHSNMYRIE